MEVQGSAVFGAEALARLDELRAGALRVDGEPPFADDLWQAAVDGHTALALAGWEADSLAGAAFVARQGDRQAAELLIDPAQRGQGLGAQLLARLLAEVDGELWLWSHMDHPAARSLAERHRLDRARELLELRRPLGAGAPLPDVTLPAGVRIRPFVVGQDEAAWVEVNNAAFDWHPEQGGQTLDDIRAAEARHDFDPDGFLLAVDDDGRLLGFHWTKVHPGDPERADTDEALGEVYVLGVAPAAHGRGLGAALAVAGLRHLAEVDGVGEAQLYVEGDNDAALRLYERLDFARHRVNVAYRRPGA